MDRTEETLASGISSLNVSDHQNQFSNAVNCFGPLNFPPQKVAKRTIDPANEEDVPVVCMLCSEQFKVQSAQEEFLKHIFMKHRLVIADVHLVVSLKSYVDFWRVRLCSEPIEEFCSVMLMDVNPDGTPSPGEKYYLLSDILPEDRQLREGLQQKRLSWVLDRQQFEREDHNFSRDCLFCCRRLEGTRAEALHHLSEKHNLQLGRPDNLVFVDELLDRLQERLEQLRCLYCKNLFPDRNTLKEHMRKKQHKTINPEDTEYDKFYIINYLELGKSWREVESEKDDPVEEESWSDWCEEGTGENSLTCLYCKHQTSSLQALNCHSQVQHCGFSLDNLPLTFYLQVKLVNYIRRQVHLRQCPVCDTSFVEFSQLLDHMAEESHFRIPDQSLFDQPQYFFSTYEDDAVLCHLQDNEEDGDSSSSEIPILT